VTTDVIVVGAGPAGAATAILLAEHGLSVTLLDRARFPRPKICGEYLSPETPRLLDRLGALKAVDAIASTLKGMRITAPNGQTLVGTYRPIGGWRPYREHAMAITREAFDAILVDRVRALPVDFREQTRVTDLVVSHDRVLGVEAIDGGARRQTLRAPLTIAADGRASVVAQRLGLRRPHRLQRMAMVTYVEDVGRLGAVGEIFVDPPDYAILNPVTPGRANLSVVVPLAHAAPWSARLDTFFDARVKHLPHLARRIAGSRRVAPVRAMGPLAYRVGPPHTGGVLMVGDATGFYDPFSGEGVFNGLRSAELAAETVVQALGRGDVSAPALAGYDRGRRLASRDKERVTHTLQFVIGHRRLANLAARLLARRPHLLDLLLGVLGDFVPPRALVNGLLARARF
jgi:geranylgeranyl reductase family protein